MGTDFRETETLLMDAKFVYAVLKRHLKDVCTDNAAMYAASAEIWKSFKGELKDATRTGLTPPMLPDEPLKPEERIRYLELIMDASLIQGEIPDKARFESLVELIRGDAAKGITVEVVDWTTAFPDLAEAMKGCGGSDARKRLDDAPASA